VAKGQWCFRRVILEADDRRGVCRWYSFVSLSLLEDSKSSDCEDKPARHAYIGRQLKLADRAIFSSFH
jgi:hypothetical protein